MIIAISGLDGAGKSTQIEKLIQKLEQGGFKTKYVWARGGYTYGFEIVKKCLRFIFKKKLPPPGHSNARDKSLKYPVVQRIWLIAAIIDLIVLWGLYVRICSFFNVIVVCDRYIDDTLLDFRKNFPLSRVEEGMMWRVLKFIAPLPDHSFLFWIPVDLSLKRSIDKGEPFPDSKAVLEWRLGAYMDTATFPLENYIRVDGQESIEKISETIYSKVANTLKRRSVD